MNVFRDCDHSEIVKNWFCYTPHKKSTNWGNKSYPLYEIDFVLQIDDFIGDGWFVKVQKANKMYNGKMEIYLDWLPRIHHNQQARKYPCGVNDESLTHSVPLRVVIELLGQLRCLHQSCLSSLSCLTCLWYFVPEVHIVTKISPQMTCLKWRSGRIWMEIEGCTQASRRLLG